jgi:tRNA threonylcarbamoyladenosine biosynthesis protein TsaB
MSTLRQILATQAPVLVLDAASARIQVGWLETGAARWQAFDDEAGVGLFKGLAALGVRPTDAGAFVFCDGPGSVLGCRTAAMAVRAWNVVNARPAYAYHSLALVAHALAEPGLSVIADARRDAWHCIAAGGPLRRVPTAELAGALATPEGFRHWTPLPAGVRTVPYSLAELLPAALDADLFRATEAPDAFLHEEPTYVTWTPQVHRAPS